MDIVHDLYDYFYEDGKRRACVVGEGIVPWLEIMRKLKGMDLNISFECKKRWYPDQIEDAVTGLLREAADHGRGRGQGSGRRRQAARGLRPHRRGDDLPGRSRPHLLRNRRAGSDQLVISLKAA